MDAVWGERDGAIATARIGLINVWRSTNTHSGRGEERAEPPFRKHVAKCPFRALRGGLAEGNGPPQKEEKRRTSAANNQRENCINSRFSPFQRRAQKLFIIAKCCCLKSTWRKSRLRRMMLELLRCSGMSWRNGFCCLPQDSFADASDFGVFLSSRHPLDSILANFSAMLLLASSPLIDCCD